MVDSQPMEEEIRGAKARNVGTETHEGATRPVLQAQIPPSPSPTFIKENIDILRTMIKEHDQQAKIKATPRRLAYVDFDKEAPARSLARGFPLNFLAHPTLTEKLTMPTKIRGLILKQRTATPKKVKKVGRPKHNQKESLKEKVKV
nr:hypothetical protein [Tanacetum cinerariifolium]